MFASPQESPSDGKSDIAEESLRAPLAAPGPVAAIRLDIAPKIALINIDSPTIRTAIYRLEKAANDVKEALGCFFCFGTDERFRPTIRTNRPLPSSDSDDAPRIVEGKPLRIFFPENTNMLNLKEVGTWRLLVREHFVFGCLIELTDCLTPEKIAELQGYFDASDINWGLIPHMARYNDDTPEVL